MAKLPPAGLDGKQFTREMLTPELLDALFGTAEESAAVMRSFGRNMVRAEDARAVYPGEYVAVIGCQVVAHAAQIEQLHEQLRRQGLLNVPATAIAAPIPPRS
ncbi:MAG: DUF5678 domain-containing protein [Dehalococcoidia bacterium]